MPTPVFSISADGVDITANFRGAEMTMTITDGAGLKSDTMQIVLDDFDGSTEAPRTGAVLNPIGGYEGAMRDFGLYSVDSVVYNGWPQKITIDAKSVAAKSLAKQREPKAYPSTDFPTYGDIFKALGAAIGLPVAIVPAIAAIVNEYEAQTEENGLEFATRLAAKMNATVTVKSGHLVVIKRGAGESASGAALDRIVVKKGFNLLSYTVTEKDEPKHKEVEATYYDRAENKRKSVTVPTGMDGPKFLLRNPYQNEEEARAAAASHGKDLVRMQGDATFEIDGNPFAQAEAWAIVSGARSQVDGLWWTTTVTHNFSATGPYTVSLQCGTPSETGSASSGRSAASSSSAAFAGGYLQAGEPNLPDAGTVVA